MSAAATARDVEEPDGTRRGATGTSEVFIRAQMRAWLDYMPTRERRSSSCYHEARLLDTQQLEAWLELFTEDATYWVPLERKQEDPLETSLDHPRRPHAARAAGEAGAPPARARAAAARAHGAPGRQCRRSPEKTAEEVARRARRSQLIEFRNEKQRVYGALVEHRLRRAGESFKIAPQARGPGELRRRARRHRRSCSEGEKLKTVFLELRPEGARRAVRAARPGCRTPRRSSGAIGVAPATSVRTRLRRARVPSATAPAPPETLDIYGSGQKAFVFVHGGAWRRQTKRENLRQSRSWSICSNRER